MDVELNQPSEPADETQAFSQVPEKWDADCENVDLANQLSRIRDHRAGAYQNPNTTKAVLGWMFADLAEFEALLGHRALEILRGRLAPQDSDLKMELIDLLIRLVSQSAKVVEVENRLPSGKSSAQPEERHE